MRERYFCMLEQKIYELSYLSLVIGKNNKIRNILNIVTAISTSTSIAAWAIWKSDLYIIWGSIIALSHVVQVVRPHLWFDQYHTTLHKLENELSQIAIDIEKDWYFVDNELINDEEINNKIANYEQIWNRVSYKYLENTKFTSDKIKQIATERTDQYIKRNFGGEIESECKS